MKISLAGDHRAFALREAVKNHLESLGHEVTDCGCNPGAENTDYPIYAAMAAKLVQDGVCERGIVLCASGVGVSVTANKFKGVRCALCFDEKISVLCRQHNNANMIALPADFVTEAQAKTMCENFLTAPFEGGRHARRVDLIGKYEEDNSFTL